MSGIDDQLAEERRRLKLVDNLTGEERAGLLAYLCRWAAGPIDAWLTDREADSSGTRYDAWGQASVNGGFTVPEDFGPAGG